MRGPATLALMSLLLFHGGAQPLSTPTTEKQPGGMGGYSSSYPQSFDCGGNAELTQDDSGTTLTCDGNKVRLHTTNNMLADSVSTGCPKKGSRLFVQNPSETENVGVFWKIQDKYCRIGNNILKSHRKIAE